MADAPARRRVIRRTEMTVAEAEALTNEIVECIETSFDAAGRGYELALEAYQRRAWDALGYDTWEEYSAARLPEITPSQEVLQFLREGGMSLRGISAVTGKSKDSVQRALASTVSNETVDDEAPGHEVAVLGLDGKRRTSRPTPKPAPPPVEMDDDEPVATPSPAALRDTALSDNDLDDADDEQDDARRKLDVLNSVLQTFRPSDPFHPSLEARGREAIAAINVYLNQARKLTGPELRRSS